MRAARTLPAVEPLAISPGSTLVRLRVDEAPVPSLPSTPPGTVLTVTCTPQLAADLSPSALLARGYRLVGVLTPGGELPEDGRVVDILVPHDLRSAHPAWWHALVARAWRVHDLDLGPVRRVLDASLRAHLPRPSVVR